MRAIAYTTFLVAVVSLLAASDAAANGTISGQITYTNNSPATVNAVVQFYQLEVNDFVATVVTDAAGVYTSPSLPPGTYAILTDDKTGHINQAWQGLECSAICDLTSITAVPITTNSVSNVNFALRPGARISGTITDAATTNPIAGVLLWFIDAAVDNYFSTAVSDAMGHYQMDAGTDNGSVYVLTLNSQGYRNEVYNNHYCDGGCDISTIGNPIVIAGGANATGIDFALDRAGQITGTVTDTTPNPLPNVKIDFLDTSGNYVESTVTDAMGHYGSPGLVTGSYYVQTHSHQNFVDKVYDDKLCPGFCDPTQIGTLVAVTSPATTSGINFALPPGGTLQGTVTAAIGGAPIKNIFIAIFDSGGTFLTGAQTNETGTYSRVLLPGTYYAAVISAPGWANQMYDHIPCPGFCNILSGTQIHVTVGNTVSGINFSLAAGATITGTVTNAANSSPLSNITVQLFSSTGAQLESINTDAMGHYTFSNLNAASFYVRTGTGGAFINLLYNSGGNVVCVFCTVTTSGGSLIVVTTGSTTSGIDFALSTGGRISGTILKSVDNQPVPAGVNGQIFSSTGLSMGAFPANAMGFYISAGLPAGTYYVKTQNTINFINKLYNNKPCTQNNCAVTSGDPVAVTLNNTTGSIDFSLDLGGSFGGKVTNAATTAGISGAQVRIYNSGGTFLGSAVANGSGNYATSGLPAGNYYARSNAGSGFIEQEWNGISCPLGSCDSTITSGTAIAISVGVNTGNVNFPLSLGGRIGGMVTNVATGLPISGAQGKVYSSGGALLGFGPTDGSGNYLTGGLPGGTYYARTDATGYNTRVYNNKPCTPCNSVPAIGTPINVVAGSTTAGISYALTATAAFTFTDGAIFFTITPVKAVHITELRTAINLLRSQLGIAQFIFTDGALAPALAPTSGTVIKAIHILQLRAALNDVYDALGLAHPTYTDPVLTGVIIKGAHILEIRSAIQAVQ